MSKKRDKRSERPSADFRNQPFAPLKGFAPPDRPAPPLPRTDAVEDSDELFRKAMSGTRRINGPTNAAAEQAAASPPAREEIPEEAEADEGLFLDALRALGTGGFRDHLPAPDDVNEDDRAGSRSSSRRMRQLRKGAIRISQELDLHGFVKDEALRRLEHFIASASARGLEAVLVITGKGANSPDGPVLPAAVAQWLRGPGLRYAAEFHHAPRDKGGSGALVVFLRRR